jgi:hypothetical protein
MACERDRVMSDHDFTKDRFNWFKQILADHTLPPNAFRLAFAISTKVNGKTRRSFAYTIEHYADLIGVTARRTKGLRRQLIERGHLTVIKGTGLRKGNASIYSMAFLPLGQGDASDPLSTPQGDASVHTGGRQRPPYSWSNTKREGDAPNGAQPPPRAPSGAGDGDVVSCDDWRVFEDLWREWSTGRKKADSQTDAWRAWYTARRHAEVHVITAGAKAWMAAQKPRYRQSLDNWLAVEGWRQTPPEPGKASESRRKSGKPSLAGMAMRYATGGDQ